MELLSVMPKGRMKDNDHILENRKVHLSIRKNSSICKSEQTLKHCLNRL